jgi:hypothetical protein
VGGPVTPGTSTCSGCSSASSGASSSPILLAQRSSLRTRASATGDCFDRQERERCGDSCQKGSQRGAIVESPCGGSPAMASPIAPRHGTALRPPDPSDSVSADPADGVRPGRPSSATLFRPRGPTVGPLPRPPGLRRSGSYSVPFASAWRDRGESVVRVWIRSLSVSRLMHEHGGFRLGILDGRPVFIRPDGSRLRGPGTADHQLGAQSFCASEGSLGSTSVGMRPVIDVPLPGADRTSSTPPITSMRSAMPRRPVP